MYPATLKIYIVSLQDDFARVVGEEVRQANAKVSVPISEVRFVGEALGTFIV